MRNISSPRSFSKFGILKKSKRHAGQKGFTYVEVIISMVILTVGILGAMSALTYSLIYMQIAEKRTQAKQIAGATLETIFAVRDIQSTDGIGIDGWDYVQNKVGNNNGIFLTGWTPVRQSSGTDGIYGTADDACDVGQNCSTSAVINGYERQIEIKDIIENGSSVILKRRINVTVRYRVNGNNYYTETVSTIIANLPFD
jgi:prepilin-type N-terminal cleavage/methylation domain-containing protein